MHSKKEKKENAKLFPQKKKCWNILNANRSAKSQLIYLWHNCQSRYFAIHWYNFNIICFKIVVLKEKKDASDGPFVKNKNANREQEAVSREIILCIFYSTHETYL